MRVGSLELPARLTALISAGRWPRNQDEANRQNVEPLVSARAIQRFAPEERTIFLYPPPFHTIQAELASGTGLSREEQAVQDIDPQLTVPIGDFGLGSDTAIALDFRNNPQRPTVIRLQWRLPREPNRWLFVANSFDEFWDIAGVAIPEA